MNPTRIVPAVDFEPLAKITSTWDDTIRFYLNGSRVILDNIDPEVTLLEYLRGIGLTGTKLYETPSYPASYRCRTTGKPQTFGSDTL